MMSPHMVGQEMSSQEIRKFLRMNDFGVLSLGLDNMGYGLPMSYSYDEENRRLILGFVPINSGKKEKFMAESEEVTLTIHQFEDVDTWESVIITGSLHLLENVDIPEDLLPVYFKLIDNPENDVKWINTDEIGRTLHELRISDMTGRYSGQFPSNSA